MSIKLTPRLQRVADYIVKGSIVADIGTDHAYLPIYLIQNGVSPLVYACDIKSGPLLRAKICADKYIFNDKRIKFILTDGIEKVPNSDVYTIAGMGGETTSYILEKSKHKFSIGQQFVLQPMTARSELRRYLYSNGFETIDECTVLENKNKFYNILYCKYTQKNTDFSEGDLHFSKALRMHKDNVTAMYYEFIMSRISKVIDGKKNKIGYDFSQIEDDVNLYQDLRRIGNEYNCQ